MKIYFLLIAVTVAVTSVKSQERQWTSAEIYQGLQKLKVLGSVLYIAAHPDDENTRLITYFAKDKLYRTGYLSLTRGDGGQNLIGDEQGIELGLIRTQELLAARRIDGGEQFFSRAYDFGYSKTPEETFSKWDKEKILADVVWVIRSFKPDVIITRFPTTGEGGHGHHTASAILANEAFTAAADPNKFPEQLKYVDVWQPKRILWNTFNFGGTNLTREDQFKIDVGGYNALLGKSYGEIAAESRSQHKSQGFGVPASRGESLEYFRTTGGNAPVKDLFEDVNTSWSKIDGGNEILGSIDEAIRNFDFLHPENSVKNILAVHKKLSALPKSYWRDIKLAELEQLILQVSGLFVELTTNEANAVLSDSLRLNFSLINRLGIDAVLNRIESPSFDTSLNLVLNANTNKVIQKTVLVNDNFHSVHPYWLQEPMNEGYFTVNDQLKIGQPDIDPAYRVRFHISVNGTPFVFNRDLKYKYTDPVRGELYQPLVVLSPVVFGVDEKLKLSVNKPEFRGTITAQSKTSKPLSVENFTLSPSIKNNLSTYKLSFNARNEMHEINYTAEGNNSQNYRIGVSVKPVSQGLSERKPLAIRQIRYDHIPVITYFETPEIRNVRVDLKIYNRKIGYIVGAGDKVPEALEQMGYEVTLLTDKELSRNSLNRFDVIMTGVRAHNTNEWMNKHYDKLMKFVEDGGNLIVQYNTSNNIGPVRAKIGPYNFGISRTRVTDENSPVIFVNPTHPALNFPNKISQDDFKGWIQERSIYHAADWDKTKFETVIAMNDTNEKAEDGSLIIAKHGKGYFTYTGLVFFRQLPAGVPGAYRLLANLIALNRKKPF